jgi:hypothetical protein
MSKDNHRLRVVILALLINLTFGCGGSASKTSPPATSPRPQITPRTPIPESANEPVAEATLTPSPETGAEDISTTATQVILSPTSESALGHAGQDTATSTQAVTINLLEELYFHWGGGGSGPLTCYGHSGSALPEIRTEWMGPAYPQRMLLCIYGFNLGEEIAIDIYNPQGENVAFDVYQVVEEITLAGEPVDEILVIMELPLSLSHGEWQVVAHSTSTLAQGFFQNGLCNDTYPEVITHHRILPNDLRSPLDLEWFVPYSIGDRMRIQGICFAPNQEIEIGIYGTHAESMGWEVRAFRSKFMVKTDEFGVFVTEVTVDPSLLINGYGGSYAIVPAIESNLSLEAEGIVEHNPEVFTVFNLTPYTPERYCDYASRLSTGMQAYVGDDLPNNVRSGPDLDANLLGKIQPGEVVEIIEGPGCNYQDAMVWWYVHSLETGIAGWTAEGDQDGYWLVPYTP